MPDFEELLIDIANNLNAIREAVGGPYGPQEGRSVRAFADWPPREDSPE